jgi:ASC-1-like (ASCH) protein
MTHDLKIWPDYFAAVKSGMKTAELREDDRSFRVGDTLCLNEWDPVTLQFSGRFIHAKITYVQSITIDVLHKISYAVLSFKITEPLVDL